MFKAFNNKTLLIVFGALVALFILLRFVNSGKSKRNFRADLGQVDTAAVSSILLYPKSEQQAEITFTRTGEEWQVSKEGISGSADLGAVESLLDALETLKPKRPVARSQEKWEEYLLTDSLATRVKVMEGSKTSLDLLLGKTGFQQLEGGGGGQFGQQQPNIVGTSYVRIAGEEEVYAVDGFLSMSFDRNFNSWRDKSLASFPTASLTNLSYQYPADSGFTLVKADSVWQMDGALADSASVQQYLGQIANLSSSQFADDASVSAPTHQVQVSGDNMSPISLDGYTDGTNYYLRSSLRPDVWFADKALFERVFVGKAKLMGE